MKYFLWGLAAIILLGVTSCVTMYVGAATSVATAPARVITDTMRTENIINSYNGFYKLHSSIQSAKAGITDYEAQTMDEPDLSQQRLMKTNLFAMRQTCRTMVNTYNANAEKLTAGLFKDWRLPQFLNAGSCEQ